MSIALNTSLNYSKTQKILCKHPRYNSRYTLSALHIELLQLVAYNGFLTYDQMSRYSQILTNDSSKRLSKATLSRWTAKRSGLLSKVTKEHHSMYYLNPWVVNWLCEHMFLNERDITGRSPNMHNLLLNESICTSIYKTWLELINDSYYGYHASQIENGFALIRIAANLSSHRNKANRIIQHSMKMLNDKELLDRASYQEGIPDWLYGIDIRSFNRQMEKDFEESQDIELKPDAMIKCDNRIIFIELDNRTESNHTLINKMKTYIDYAIKHPQYLYSMEFVFNDGSVRNGKITQFKIPYKKFSMLIKETMAEPMLLNGKALPTFRGYEYARNLKIYIAPLKECWVDVRDVLLNKRLDKQIHQAITSWNKNNRLYQIIVRKQSHKPKSRYLTHNYPGLFGKKNTPLRSPKMQIILGQEHLLDTLLGMLNARHIQLKRGLPFLIIYPYRNEQVHALYHQQLINHSLRDATCYQFHNPMFLQLTPNYDYRHPQFRVMSNPSSTEAKELPLDESRFV